MKILLSTLVGLLSFLAGAVSLNGEWRLSYRFQQEGGDWKTVSAQVPGDVSLDLERAGLLSDATVGTNVYARFWTERCEWKYEKSFPGVACAPGERLELRFGGVDTRAEYWLNGERLGASDNMFIPVSFDVTDKIKDRNTLVVHIRSILGQPDLGVLGHVPRHRKWRKCSVWSGGGALAVAWCGQISRSGAEARRVENTSLLHACSQAARGAPETFPLCPRA